MTTPLIDLDRLAAALRERMKERGLSLRKAAVEIGCSAPTLSRIMQGARIEMTPDTDNVIRCASWLGESIAAFEKGARPPSPVEAVKAHLRGVPSLSKRDAEAIRNLVQAAYDRHRLKPGK